jgi:hypothetical protein
MSEKITGSCLCSAVKYIVNGSVKAVANCHCKVCKKTTGGAFATIAIIAEHDFEIITGEDALATYQVSDRAIKYFCRTCGTPLYNLHKKYPGNCMTAVGSFDDPSLVTPAINIFCENMLPWVKEVADLKCFDREPTR